MENNMKEDIREIIEDSVDKSVKRAFKRHGMSITAILVIVLILTGIMGALTIRNSNPEVMPVEDHDLTLENNGILGFSAADFEEPVLGAASRKKLLIVEEQEVYVNTTLTDAGLFNLGVFNKEQVVTIHGTGQYTIDLSEITSQDISLNEDTYELTISIPHAALQTPVTFDPSKTEIGDTDRGWLAFGEIKKDQEEQKLFEENACKKLEKKLREKERFSEAEQFAKLSAYETFQPVVSAVSPAYKVVIDFK